MRFSIWRRYKKSFSLREMHINKGGTSFWQEPSSIMLNTQQHIHTFVYFSNAVALIEDTIDSYKDWIDNVLWTELQACRFLYSRTISQWHIRTLKTLSNGNCKGGLWKSQKMKKSKEWKAESRKQKFFDKVVDNCDESKKFKKYPKFKEFQFQTMSMHY